MAVKFHTQKEAAVPSASTKEELVDKQTQDGISTAQRQIRRDLEALNTSGGSPGTIYPYCGIVIPDGTLLCDGSSLLRGSYAALFAALTKSDICSMTIANPCIVTLAGHGLQTGSRLNFETTGALPTGLSVSTNYYAIKINDDTFNLATTHANALAGTKITTTGSQSGSHTIINAPWGVADSTHFNIPDLRGLTLKGAGTQAYAAWAAAAYLGIIGEYFQDRGQGHKHITALTMYYYDAGVGYSYLRSCYPANATAINATSGVPSTDGVNGTPRVGLTTEMQSAGVNFIIRY
jgi:hypothetical protein